MKEMLVMSEITKTYGRGHTEVTALKGVNLTVKEGEFVSIIGPSGSGKSTFLTIAGGLLQASSGQLKINDEDWTELSEKARANLRFKEIGFILQASNLIPFLTVSEHFRLVDKVEKRPFQAERMNGLLESLDLTKLAKKLPRDLSGGERQRVAIARSLYNEPSLILADEPTASLDTDRAFEVVELLAQEAREKKKATIMVTHDQRMLKWSDRVYRMEDGRLIAE